jgi:hypothetical protein
VLAFGALLPEQKSLQSVRSANLTCEYDKIQFICSAAPCGYFWLIKSILEVRSRKLVQKAAMAVGPHGRPNRLVE